MSVTRHPNGDLAPPGASGVLGGRRFFVPEPLAGHAPGAVLELPEATVHHAVRVVRLRPGEALTLFDGSGGEYTARLMDVDKRGARVRLERFIAVERESPLALTLVQAIAANDAMDYAIRKAVELGVYAIAPVLSERSAPFPTGPRGERRVDHWHEIAVSASEQSGRNRVPIVAAPRTLAEWAHASTDRAFVASTIGGSSIAALEAPAARRCAVVIGPEGGLSDSEMALLRACDAVPVALGPRVLRTETAAAAMIALLQARWGDLA